MTQRSNDATNVSQPAPVPVVSSLWNLTVLCILAWMIPGLGHFMLKHRKRAIVFFVSIVTLFYWGLSMGAKLWSYEPHQPLTFFAMVSQVGIGLPYFAARLMISIAQKDPSSAFHSLAEAFNFGTGDITRITFEYGNTFTWVAGLLNFLVILDAYDFAVGKKKKG